MCYDSKDNQLSHRHIIKRAVELAVHVFTQAHLAVAYDKEWVVLIEGEVSFTVEFERLVGDHGSGAVAGCYHTHRIRFAVIGAVETVTEQPARNIGSGQSLIGKSAGFPNRSARRKLSISV